MNNISKIYDLDLIMIKQVFGEYDSFKKTIENKMNVELIQSSNGINIEGDQSNVTNSIHIINMIISHINSNKVLTIDNINYFISIVNDKEENYKKDSLNNVICVTHTGNKILPKTFSQNKYSKLINDNDIVFSIGSAGTGKSFIAVAKAVDAFKKKKVDRIILTRPAVEAGEKLGFLPGDLQMKVDPYLRPLFDALNEILGRDMFEKLREKEVIEVAPLAYMRGRTLNNSFIILDEAQNTSIGQMKMFLTRIGVNSKAVINGDLSQTDLPDNKKSGLLHAIRILKDVPEIETMTFTKKDVVRHKLVMDIIRAYEKTENK